MALSERRKRIRDAREEKWEAAAARTIAKLHTPKSLATIFDKDDAESIALIALWQNREQSRGYRFRAGVHAVIDEVRRQRGRKGGKADSIAAGADPLDVAAADAFFDTHASANMETLLTFLPDAQQAAVVEGLFVHFKTPAELARNMGLTAGRISQIKGEALLYLKTLIDADGAILEDFYS